MPTGLPIETLWRAKQMYEEKDELGRRRWTMMAIAAHLGISETSVLRAVRNAGRFANFKNEPLPEVKSDALLKEAAGQSLEKLKKMIAEERAEGTAGETTADKLLEELEAKGEKLEEGAKDKLKRYV